MNYANSVKSFEKRMGWDRTPSADIIKFIKKDAKEITARNADHKLVDIMFECVQLAIRKNIRLDKELRKHMIEAERKYRVKK